MSTRSRNGRGRGRGKGQNSGWEEWGGYMPAKIQKLQAQFQSDEAGSSHQEGHTTNIFKGVAIHVNGYTNPTSDELKHLMKQHGGVYHHYYSRSYVTHIIASNLPTSKIRQLTDQKVVKPQWITESVKAGKLLPYQDFLLVIKQSGIQRSLSRISSTASSTCKEAASVIEDTEANQLHENDVVNVIDEGVDKDNIIPVDDTNEKLVNNESDVNNVDIETIENKSSANLSSLGKSLKSPSKSVRAGDPNFVSEFYGHSRLHHIAQWGAEYKAYVNELQAKGCTSFPGRERLRNYHEVNTTRTPDANMSVKIQGKPKRVILHIDMDCFFVSVGLRKRPDLIGKPVAVTHSKGNSNGAPKNRPGTNLSYEIAHWKRKTQPKKRKGQSEEHKELNLLFEDEADVLAEEMDVTEPITEETGEDSFYSMAEIASCSYEARAAGVKNGTFMGPAKKLCPELVAIPYDFAAYKEVSQILYDTVASYTYDIEAVSCDEMLVDCTDLLADTGATPTEFASLLRQEIHHKTGCNASAGLGPDILLARLSTRKAKPNGQFWLHSSDVLSFILDKCVGDLPGVGWTIRSKLHNMNVKTCEDLQAIPLATLQKEFGPKNGQSLHNFCRGKDDRPIKVEKERKSVSAEINYGIRFSLDKEADRFLYELAEEVHNRLGKINMKGKTITLKLKVRKEDAPKETAKYLGHGACDSIAKSTTLPVATDDPKVIGKECVSILRPLGVPVDDIRGIGISMTRLEAPIGSGKNSGLQTILNFATPVTSKTTKTVTAPEMHVDNSFDTERHVVPVTQSTSDAMPPAVEESTEMPTELSPEIPLAGPIGINTSLPPLPMLPDFSSPESSQNSQPDSQPEVTEQPQHSTPQHTAAPGKQLNVTPVIHPRPLNEDQFLISPSQVDPDVLRELPEDIRHQIETVMNRQKKVKETPKCKLTVAASSHSNEEQPGCSHWSRNTPPQSKANMDGQQGQDNQVDQLEHIEDVHDDIVPLPNLSQLDESCLNALPEDMQAEIREAYQKQAQSGKNKEPVNKMKSTVRDAPAPLRLNQASPTKSPKKSPGKSPTKAKSPAKSTKLKGSPQFKVPQGRGPGRKKKLSPKKLKFNTQSRIDQPQNRPTMVEERDLLEQHPTIDTEVVTGVNFCGAVSLQEVKTLMKEWICSCPNAPDGEDLGMVVSYMAALIDHKDLEKVYLLIKFLTRNIKKLDSNEWNIGLDTIVSHTQALVVDSYGWQLKI